MCSNQCRICGGPGDFRWYEEEMILSPGVWRKIKGEINACDECGRQIYLQGNLGRQLVTEGTTALTHTPLVTERTTALTHTPFKLACLLHERVLKDLGECPIGFRMSSDGDSTDGEYGVLHDYEKWIDAFPQTPLEHIDRALLNIYRKISREGGFFTNKIEIPIDNKDPFCCRALFCGPCQADDLLEMMAGMGYVETSNANCRSAAESLTMKLAPRGLHRIADLHASQSGGSDRCFVAMAYHEGTEDYRAAVHSAIEQAGYHAEVITVDEEHHNDFIMDRVINMIDDARFVIADLTVLPEIPPGKKSDGTEKEGKAKNGVRGGVYWEAGYAKGRGKEVIFTCNDDGEASKNRIHFDIEQIARLRWTKDRLEEFIGDLATRIVATVGKGPHYPSG